MVKIPFRFTAKEALSELISIGVGTAAAISGLSPEGALAIGSVAAGVAKGFNFSQKTTKDSLSAVLKQAILNSVKTPNQKLSKEQIKAIEYILATDFKDEGDACVSTEAQLKEKLRSVFEALDSPDSDVDTLVNNALAYALDTIQNDQNLTAYVSSIDIRKIHTLVLKTISQNDVTHAMLRSLDEKVDQLVLEKPVENILDKAPKYKELINDINELQADLSDLSLPQERKESKIKRLSEKVQQKVQLEKDVTALYEQITRVPINTERGRLTREYFEAGQFEKAYDTLNQEVIDKEVKALKEQRASFEKRLEDTNDQLADLAREYALKACLSLTLIDNPQRFEDAETLFDKAIETSRVPDVLTGYALYLYSQNQFNSAEPLFAEALVIRRKLVKTNPNAYLPSLATTLDNLAGLHNKTNKHKKAEDEYTEALVIRRKLVETSPDAYLLDLALTLNNLAELHGKTNKYEEAEKEYTEALDICRSLGLF